MAKGCLLIAFLALAFTASASPNFLALYEIAEEPIIVMANSANTTNMTFDQIYLAYLTTVARGSLQGFTQGFYANTSFKVSNSCLSTNA